MKTLHHMIFLPVVFLIIIGLGNCGAEIQFTNEKAVEFLQAYVETARSGDSTEVHEFWSEESRDKDNFHPMIISRGGFGPFSEFHELLQSHTFEINSIKVVRDYQIVDLEWVPIESSEANDSDARIPMRYYIVIEDNKFKLTNPVDVLTRDWQKYETDLFAFHYPPEINTAEYLHEMEKMDDECKRIADFLEIEPSGKVDFYRARDGIECGELILHPPGYGYAASQWNLITSATFLNAHEYVHFISMPELGYLSAAFCEGLCVGLAGGGWYTADFSVSQSRNLLDSDMFVPLEDLIFSSNNVFLGNAEVTYHEAGAFVRFLLDRYGYEKFKELHDRANIPDEDKLNLTPISVDSLRQYVEEVYDCTAEKLAVQWSDYLQNPDMPPIKGGIPDNTELLFSMDDPTGDDDGDGDYAYPTDKRFKEGVFDLTGFEVFKDSRDVYFRLRFRNLIKPVLNSRTNQTFAAGAVLALKRGDRCGDTLKNQCYGVVFEEGNGYDLMMHIGRGIIVFDNFGKACYAGADIFNEMADLEKNRIEFSVPLSLTGEPAENWEYFVGTCPVNDLSLGFLRSYPAFVQARAGPFNFGGGEGPLSPPFIDILLPGNINQADVLGGYNSSKGIRAVVPMVGS